MSEKLLVPAEVVDEVCDSELVLIVPPEAWLELTETLRLLDEEFVADPADPAVSALTAAPLPETVTVVVPPPGAGTRVVPLMGDTFTPFTSTSDEGPDWPTALCWVALTLVS